MLMQILPVQFMVYGINAYQLFHAFHRHDLFFSRPSSCVLLIFFEFTRCIKDTIATGHTQYAPWTSSISQIATTFASGIFFSILRYFSFLYLFCPSFFHLCQCMRMSSENNFVIQNEDQAPKQIIFWLSSFDNEISNGNKCIVYAQHCVHCATDAKSTTSTK